MSRVEVLSRVLSNNSLHGTTPNPPPRQDWKTQKLGTLLVFQEIFRPASFVDRATYFVGIVCSVGSGAILPLMTLVFGTFTTKFTDFAVGKTNGASFRLQVNHYAIYFVYLFIAKAILSYISMVSLSIVSTRVTAALRLRYLREVLRRDITFHEAELSSGTVSITLSSHCNTIQSGLADKFGLSVQSISTVASAFIVAFTSQWKLALVTATIVPAIVLVVGTTSVFYSKLEEAINTTNTEAASVAEEMLSTVRTVRALNATEKLLRKYQEHLKRAKSLGWKLSPIKGAQVCTYMFLIYAAYALAFWYGVRLFARHEVSTVGKVITTLFSIIIGTNAFSQLAGYLGSFMRISAAGVELFRIIEHREGDEHGKSVEVTHRENFIHSLVSTVPKDLPKGEIEFRDISFCYPLRPDVQVLKEFSLSIPLGKMTALVGQSGSGKSTIVSLLERWYEPGEGSISIGGQNVNQFRASELRESIGLVQQEPFLFSTTILENVLFGLTESAVGLSNEDKKNLVVHACKEANAHDFITKLPEGYATSVGPKATLISGGQKQRLAIARAIIGNPSILILDEATSALDPASEQAVQHALKKASLNRTTIAIAHRLSSIQHADKIVVMGHGRLLEEGTHEELMAKPSGRYHRLFSLQMLSASGNTNADYLEDPPVSSGKKANFPAKIDPNSERALGNKTSQKHRSHTVNAFTTFFRTMYEQRNHWTAYSVLFVGCLGGGALFPLQAYLYAKLVSTFQLTGHALISRGNFWALMFFVLALVIGLSYLVIAGLSAGLGEAIGQSYRLEYLSSMLKQRVAFFDSSSNSSGSLLSRLATDPESLKSLAGPNIGVIIVVSVSVLSTLILSLAVDWKLALVAIFGAFPFIFGAGFLHEAMENSFEERAGRTFADSVGFAGECIQAIKTVSSLRMEGVVETRFGQMLEEHCRRASKHILKTMIWFSLSEAIDMLCMGLTFWYGGHQLSHHESTTTQFFVVFVAIVLSAQSIGQFFAHSSDVSKGISAGRAIYAMRQSEPENLMRTQKTLEKEDSSSDAPIIEFRDAVFSYPTRPSPVLRGLNLTLHRGQFIAIVGPSGSGKSTIVGLLERFYDLTSGQLLIDGVDPSTLDIDYTRRRLALVSQEPTLYSGTIKENVLLGTDVDLSLDELESIARQAQIHDLIFSLPEGWDTQVGARGTALSGGQKQRIAIARALVRRSEVLLLDEATSALDSESEGLVQKAIRESGKGKGVIAIAHRLSTIQYADIIHVLNEGVIAERGNHGELMSKKGIYYHMCLSQGVEATL